MTAALTLQGEFSERVLGRRLWFVPACGSTNELMARQRARFAPGDVLWAGGQTAGRGRYGRAWFTAPGALALTLLLAATDEQPARLPMVLALGLVRWLATHGVAAQIKWPNDVYRDGRKLAGILTEGDRRGSAWELRVGIGLNVQVAEDEFPPAVRGVATSLSQAGLDLSREQVLAELLPHLNTVWHNDRAGGWPALRAAVDECLLWRGQRVCVTQGEKQWTGALLGLADNGGLRVNEKVVMAGEVAPLTEEKT